PARSECCGAGPVTVVAEELHCNSARPYGNVGWKGSTVRERAEKEARLHGHGARRRLVRTGKRPERLTRTRTCRRRGRPAARAPGVRRGVVAAGATRRRRPAAGCGVGHHRPEGFAGRLLNVPADRSPRRG